MGGHLKPLTEVKDSSKSTLVNRHRVLWIGGAWRPLILNPRNKASCPKVLWGIEIPDFKTKEHGIETSNFKSNEQCIAPFGLVLTPGRDQGSQTLNLFTFSTTDIWASTPGRDSFP
ncbi:uncharacterized protein G2W53_017930 [Senna tora]|uniref:Uncharacterized protein n=1 Tax=Senna tora TaxID=362788 RepID=A0A834TTQ0_9FABA|nr:uncharacterized protein G2W53_017930 [Senna tora]